MHDCFEFLKIVVVPFDYTCEVLHVARRHVETMSKPKVKLRFGISDIFFIKSKGFCKVYLSIDLFVNSL